MPSHSRRDFVKTTGLALGAMVVPRRVLGMGWQAPSATLNIALVGAGGRGLEVISRMTGENIAAICDVDFPYVERSINGRLRPRSGREPSAENVALGAAYAKAVKYGDFREMFEQEPGIDAVVIATPDHLHAPIAMAAMRRGKHVYVEKPLAYSVHETRLLARTARETGVVAEMGNQGHSQEGTRRIVELIASGVIGPVREVHIWTDRPVRFWAQGIPRPGQDEAERAARAAAAQAESRSDAAQGGGAQGAAAAGARPQTAPPASQSSTETVPPRWNMRTVERAILREMAANPQSPPPELDWDGFLGPAPAIPYHPAYHPFSWRGWVDFGVGALGDMGAHLVDQAYWALGLEYPTSIVASSTPWGGPADDPASYPLAMTCQYEFPARGAQPPVQMYWYDGGLLPPRPPHLPDDVPLPLGAGGGGVFVGERGILTYEVYGEKPTVYPASVAAEAEAVPKSVQRIEARHELNWVQACKGEAQVSAPFDYSARLTETMLLGLIALRVGQGKKIYYDGPNMRITNVPEANALLTREYRAGWEL